MKLERLTGDQIRNTWRPNKSFPGDSSRLLRWRDWCSPPPSRPRPVLFSKLACFLPPSPSPRSPNMQIYRFHLLPTLQIVPSLSNRTDQFLSRPSILRRRPRLCYLAGLLRCVRRILLFRVLTLLEGRSTGAAAPMSSFKRLLLLDYLHKLFTSAWTGFFAGCLHTLSGPDHLVALAPLSIGRTRTESAIVGALWGCGHDAGQLIFGMLFLLHKDRLHMEVI